MLPGLGAWTLPLSGAVAVLSDYSTAACEAVISISECSEVLLKTALAFTNSLSLYLSAMLRLNAFLRLALARVLLSREFLDQRRRSSCSRASTVTGCSPLCWGEASCSEPVRRVQALLRAVPTLCRRAGTVCAAVSALGHGVLSPTASTLATACGSVRPALLSLLTATGFSAQLLDLAAV